VLIIYSPVQRAHQPACVVKQGERSASFDVPERVDSILSAINEQELGPVVAPDDAGLEPIRTVHDTGVIEYLMTAYEWQNAEAGVLTPVFPTFFPPLGQRRRPGCFEGQKGFYCTNTGVPIDEHTWKLTAGCLRWGVVACCH
jgi:acetoin utilization deacetylase AcuC-like enzyme